MHPSTAATVTMVDAAAASTMAVADRLGGGESNCESTTYEG